VGHLEFFGGFKGKCWGEGPKFEIKDLIDENTMK
jgi:hypothetical protein